MKRVVGVDPGGRWTGVVLRDADKLLRARVVTRVGDAHLPGPEYFAEVYDVVDDMLEEGGADTLLAAEGIVHPEPHMSIVNVLGLVGTGMVLAVVLATWPETIVVRPNKHGALPDVAYPEGIRKNVRLGGPSEHARSAWDVAGAGRFQARVRAVS